MNYFSGSRFIIYNCHFDLPGWSEIEKNLTEKGVSLSGFSRPKIYSKLIKEIHKRKYKNLFIEEDIMRSCGASREFSGLIENFKNFETYPSGSNLVPARNEFAAGIDIAEEISGRIKECPGKSAVVTDSDMTAEGIACRFLENRISIPEKAGITGFDDLETAPYFKVLLTSIKVPVESMP
ncbi:MAG: substrate-binding domain-containing protein [Fibrobacterota bacterium]